MDQQRIKQLYPKAAKAVEWHEVDVSIDIWRHTVDELHKGATPDKLIAFMIAALCHASLYTQYLAVLSLNPLILRKSEQLKTDLKQITAEMKTDDFRQYFNDKVSEYLASTMKGNSTNVH